MSYLVTKHIISIQNTSVDFCYILYSDYCSHFTCITSISYALIHL